MRIQQSPNPHLPRSAKPSGLAPKDDRRMQEWAELNKHQIPEGRSLIVDLGDGHRYVVEGTKVSPAKKGFSALQQFLTAGVQEVQAAIQAGPSLALTAATEVVKPMVMNNAPYEVAANIDQWYQPGLMGVSVGLSLIKFARTYDAHMMRQTKGQPDSMIQTVGLWANGIHVATTAAGLAGVVGAALVPSLQGIGATAQGVALAGNVVAFGINWLEYFNNRSQTLMPLDNIKKPQ
jgi:hypothetical protein